MGFSEKHLCPGPKLGVGHTGSLPVSGVHDIAGLGMCACLGSHGADHG